MLGETYRAAERQCVRSGDLKPAGAKACASPTTRLKPKDVKEELSALEAPETTHIKPKDENGALAAPGTMHLKPKDVN